MNPDLRMTEAALLLFINGAAALVISRSPIAAILGFELPLRLRVLLWHFGIIFFVCGWGLLFYLEFL